MSQPELQPRNYSETFGLLKLSVQQRAEDARKVNDEKGKQIKQQIGVVVSAMNNADLPMSLFIADDTQNQKDATTRTTQVRYIPTTNRLIKVSRLADVGTATDFESAITNPSVDTTSVINPMVLYMSPEELEAQFVFREVKDEEWVRYGPTVVNAIEAAVLTTQQAKKQ